MPVQEVDALLQVEQPDASLDSLKVADDATSPTLVALPTLDGGVRARLDTANAALAALTAAVDGLEGNTTGLATQTTLAAAAASLVLITAAVDTLEANTTGLASQATLALILTAVDGIEALLAALSVTVSNFPASYPLPSGQVSTLTPLALQPVSATDLDIRDLLLTQDSVRQTQRVMSSYVAAQSSADGAVIAANVTSPTRIRVLRLDGGSKPSNTVDTFCTVTIALGATNIFVKELQVGEPIGGQVCIEGAAGEDLTVTVTGTGTVQFQIRYELFV